MFNVFHKYVIYYIKFYRYREYRSLWRRYAKGLILSKRLGLDMTEAYPKDNISRR